jgi:hypothetical protein
MTTDTLTAADLGALLDIELAGASSASEAAHHVRAFADQAAASGALDLADRRVADFLDELDAA